MGGFISTLAFYEALLSDIEDIPSVTVLVLNWSSISDHFGRFRPAGSQQKSFVFVIDKDGTTSGMRIAKALLLFNLSCPTYEKENEYIFLPHIECIRTLDIIDSRLCQEFLGFSADDDVAKTMIQPNAYFGSTLFVGEWFENEPLPVSSMNRVHFSCIQTNS